MKSLATRNIARIVAAFFCAAAIVSHAQTFKYGQLTGITGANPIGAPVQGLNGDLYGTTDLGGAYNSGVIYKLTPDGKYSKIYDFCSKSDCIDGQYPQGLILAANGNLYGLTLGGGANNGGYCEIFGGCGTVFELTPSGQLITLYSFCSQANCADGAEPLRSLVQGVNGNFYGTTIDGGSHCMNCGTVFEISPQGQFTSLHSFCSPQVCKDGSQPEAGLVLASDGNFYGTTSAGGAFDDGTVFKMTPGGTGSILHSFCSEANCADGASPQAALIQGTDGNLYGTTAGGGAYLEGVVFQLTLGGTFTTLHAFCSEANCADGQTPFAPVMQANDGSFYGTTASGAALGSIFEMTPDGTVTTLYNFCVTGYCLDGYDPLSGLTQYTDGRFYGSANVGGIINRKLCPSGCGTIYQLSMGLGPLVIANPQFAKIGQKINILGTSLTGATSVTFNGTPATDFTVTDTYIRATVPTGATSGIVQVTTPSGTLSTVFAFQVLP
ncbi:MAG TPA: choice-of-anchor tandem repeat GloVer-containing protein [Candidatus Eisenbacteria bacterium]|nr:choice-of-anchor tandem repeat GloVer-containing protein [Candidatus Eisenbacteria bacterium]